MKPDSPASSASWTAIDTEKRRDRFIRRVNAVAWTVTFAVVLFIAAVIGMQVAHTMKLVSVGMAEPTAVYWSAMPLVVTLGTLSLLIAILTTVGMFLRLRTASLSEIQLRLAALEGMLASQRDGSD